MAAQKMFMIHNTVRRVETRLLRAKAPAHPRMNLLLGGGLLRIVRGKYAIVAERTLMRILPELVKGEANGSLKVTDMTRRRINLQTLETTDELHEAAPPPHPPLDSAWNDENFGGAGVGNPMPQAPGMRAETDEVPVPSLVSGEDGPADESVEEVLVDYAPTDEEDLERMMAEEVARDAAAEQSAGSTPKKTKRSRG